MKTTAAYTEMEIPLSNAHSLVVYVLRRRPGTVWFATCWGDVCCRWLEAMEGYGADIIACLRPLLAALLANGIQSAYRDGALVWFRDPDDQVEKWFLVCEARNVPGSTTQAALARRGQRAMNTVIRRTLELTYELREDCPALQAAGADGLHDRLQSLERALDGRPVERGGAAAG